MDFYIDFSLLIWTTLSQFFYFMFFVHDVFVFNKWCMIVIGNYIYIDVYIVLVLTCSLD